ncbi:MAG: RsmB/NOP family class I SAM-dependent RNA methyltransferase [Paracoccus sp. (in: a-proteobacteria)]|uniref:RsmB/NOP family class I SAM-dependent RNA methyltransferase n=1 Tax=Paracoccus sp. TaxID=267 RepID=UPI0026E07228|nr:RsmB/NOP family class I SAM-dependent RNA methyltransferase [Paracoccus sp. (in: a-proteobacteria)]MDO5621029.1 RsmB/NOP family class I SAM-dependent RNA methyltransferase [Paracoccus sp. (in: a-proteobacteria)]
MTPGARVAAAAQVLDQILAGQAAETALLRWSRSSRFAGSGDRTAVRDLVFDALRCRSSAAAMGGELSGRGLMLGLARLMGRDVAALFNGQGHALPLPDLAGRQPDTDAASDIPAWLLPRMRADLGADFDAISAAMRLRAPVWLRVNLARVTPAEAPAILAADGVAVQASDMLPDALQVLEGARSVQRSRAYLDGLIELQDLSPQLACAAVPLRPGDSVLDYCAGGGGKALALAARQAGLARVVAHDADAGRMRDLPERARRAGTMVEIARPGQVAGAFDLVVADVPCSGSGSWRRDPDGKWRLTPSRLDELLGVQSEIMDKASHYVMPGGVLAYMTCSVLRAENQNQVNDFLSRNPDFSSDFIQNYNPLTASDGFFLAVLQRKPGAR